MEDSLELRIAAIEDKLSKLGVSQADLLAYQKVASLAAPSPSLSPQLCSITCVVSIPVHIPVHTHVGPVFAQQAAAQEGTATGFENLGK